ncbi:MAG: hypothetical protein IJ523_10045 [Succinivibrionaceae bacterium]|nr:hypothetical protein [Succinivibrionaceae bacterium]
MTNEKMKASTLKEVFEAVIGHTEIADPDYADKRLAFGVAYENLQDDERSGNTMSKYFVELLDKDPEAPLPEPGHRQMVLTVLINHDGDMVQGDEDKDAVVSSVRVVLLKPWLVDGTGLKRKVQIFSTSCDYEFELIELEVQKPEKSA